MLEEYFLSGRGECWGVGKSFRAQVRVQKGAGKALGSENRRTRGLFVCLFIYSTTPTNGFFS